MPPPLPEGSPEAVHAQARRIQAPPGAGRAVRPVALTSHRGDPPRESGSRMKAKAAAPVFSRILRVVARIPRGRVATYGQVARLAGLPNHARHVGWALHGLPAGTPVPWHRVINARG